jgi:hypothetical protein
MLELVNQIIKDDKLFILHLRSISAPYFNPFAANRCLKLPQFSMKNVISLAPQFISNLPQAINIPASFAISKFQTFDATPKASEKPQMVCCEVEVFPLNSGCFICGIAISTFLSPHNRI